MRITDLLKKESIDLNGVVTTKKEMIEKMTLLMERRECQRPRKIQSRRIRKRRRRNDRNRGRNRYSTCKDRCGEWSWTGGDDYS